MSDPQTPAAKKANYVGSRPKDESKLSTKPSQVRVRLRRAAKGNAKRDGRMERDIEMLYQKPIEDWDNEELARGRPRNKNGGFTGRVPTWITPTIQKEAKKRLLDETFGAMSMHVHSAIRTVVKLMTSEETDEKGKPIVDARTQLAAAMFLIENIVGKPKAIMEVQAEDFTRQALAGAIVLDDGLPEDHFVVVEGSVVEEPDDDET